MEHPLNYLIGFFISLGVTIAVTPLMKTLAFKFNITDRPASRKVHKKVMPYLGGVAIILGFMAGCFYIKPNAADIMTSFLVGAVFIAIVGIIDDKYSLPPLVKLLAQLAAAILVVVQGATIQFIELPLIGHVDFGWFAYPFTVLWIVAITNAINFIDGLDGLASGVSSIALTSMIVTAFLMGQSLTVGIAVALLGGTIGFLFFNVHPAKIFMGDAGSLFIGYTLAFISILGLYKSLTLLSLVVPLAVLAVPIFDTGMAIVRRLWNGQKISSPDKQHLHHRLMNLGFSHRTTVMIIYVISAFFGTSAIVFSRSAVWGSLVIMVVGLILVQFTREMLDNFNLRSKPLTNTVKKLTEPDYTSKSRGK